MSQSYSGLFQDWEIAVAKKLVNEFQKRWICLEQEEFDDLLQECLTHWFFAKGRYNASRGASQKTFMARIIRNKLTDLVRERETDKRKVAHVSVSLDESIGEGADSPTVLDTLDEETAVGGSRDSFSKISSKIDLSKALQKLSPQQRKLCQLLREEEFTITEASQYLNAPRSTIYDELKRIRKIFEKERLNEYLE